MPGKRRSWLALDQPAEHFRIAHARGVAGGLQRCDDFQRVLGVARLDEGLGELLQRFAPWIGIGLIVMAVTGALLVVGEPIREFSALSFWLKMTLLVVAVTSGEIFRRSLRGAPSGDGTAAYSSKLKTAAVVTVAIWVCIIYLGRTIAYDVEIWGSLSFNS